MENLIQFKINDTAYENGKNDAKNSIFDTTYLKLSADYALSYTAGFKSFEKKHNLLGCCVYTSEV